jgi:hypothetical protein
MRSHFALTADNGDFLAARLELLSGGLRCSNLYGVKLLQVGSWMMAAIVARTSET